MENAILREVCAKHLPDVNLRDVIPSFAGASHRLVPFCPRALVRKLAFLSPFLDPSIVGLNDCGIERLWD